MSETHCYLKVPSSSSSDTWRRPAGHGGVVCVCVCMCVWLWVSGELCVYLCSHEQPPWEDGSQIRRHG